MPRIKSASEKAAGKLISAIQKEWGEELGFPIAEESEDVMGLAHSLLQARTSSKMKEVLDGATITQYLGEEWVSNHPSVIPAIESLIKAMEQEDA
ncbi:hypothetical protein [Amphritea balenae]|uniref:Uncharacterized protein n=1 Tax=Amphritea balenae TaxID=452629 RepID=A0A3P1SM76_9GAMM|nr:hypothetical protein [Amphritea balenae]RRC98014.1 hypothetical protein EHS89_15675 [Amphritea balenae]GGK66778.1 hypothetical protein GCM10007941_16120 [Amphritea balenae]